MAAKGTGHRRQARQVHSLPLTERIGSQRALYGVAAAFLVAVSLIGGGSRGDIVSLVILRPLAVVALGYAVIVGGARAIVRSGIPAWLLLVMLAYMAIQLVPLPHAMWSALPGREVLAAHDAFLFPNGIARPITMSPAGTWNALFSLAVPLAMFALCGAIGPDDRRRLVTVAFAIVVLNVVIGTLQAFAPPGGPLHFYRITNEANPVGLFSNRNHFAIFLASTLPLIMHRALASDTDARRQPLILTLAVAGALSILVMVLASGSRAGTLLFAVAIVGSSAIAFHSLSRSRSSGRRKTKGRTWLVIAGVAATSLAVGLGVLSTSRSTAIDRFLDESLEADLRVQVAPQLWDMIGSQFPFGTGFGAFPGAYSMIERFELLRPTYLNHAHNDFLEFPIEGGLVAVGLMTAAAIWFFATGWRVFRQVLAKPAAGAPVSIGPFAYLSIAILAAGSVGDYPLRTPAIMAWAVLLACLLVDAVTPRGSACSEDNGGGVRNRPLP